MKVKNMKYIKIVSNIKKNAFLYEILIRFSKIIWIMNVIIKLHCNINVDAFFFTYGELLIILESTFCNLNRLSYVSQYFII